MSTLPEYGVVRYSNVAHAYTHLFMMLYPTVVLALEAEFGLPYDQLLTLSIGSYVLFGVGALPAGWLADRWSGTGMLAVFFLALGVSAILTGLARSTAGIAVGLSLIGLSASIYHPVGLALLVRNPARRGRTLGINGVFGGLGTAAAALVAAVLIDLFSWRAAFFVPGALSLATGVGFLWFTRGRVLASFPHDTARRGAGGVTALAWVVGSLFVIMLCSGLIYQSTQVALPKVFALRAGALGGSLTDVASKVSLVYLVAGLFQIVGGQLADRYAQKFVIAGTYFLLIPITLLTSILFGIPLLFASLAMISLNVGMLPVIDSMFTELIPPRWRGTVFGAKFVVSLGVSALGVPLVAAIFSRTGSFTMLFVVLSGAAACVAVAALLLPMAGRSTPAVQASGAVPEFAAPDKALG